MAGELQVVAAKVESLADSPTVKAMVTAGGMAAKKAALVTVAQDLGPDLAMSNFKSGRVRLGVGFDQAPGVGSGAAVVINHRPAGLWMLADQGRQGSFGPSKPIRPRRKKALSTPWGPRSSVNGSRSRGKATFRRAAARERDLAPRAAHEAWQKRASMVFGR